MKDYEGHEIEGKTVKKTVYDDDVIIVSPHCGRLIPDVSYPHLRKDPDLEFDYDHATDALFDISSLKRGTQISTDINRDVIDLNRKRDDMSDGGVFRKVTFAGNELRDDYNAGEQEKLLSMYDEYHSALEDAVENSMKKNGRAILIAGHSMQSDIPNTSDIEKKYLEEHPDYRRPSFVVSTRSGKSADSDITDRFVKALGRYAKEAGIASDVMIDFPFWGGGHIVEKYAHPEKNMHALNVEVNKGLYMDQDTLEVDAEKVKVINGVISKALEEMLEG